jgi:hypothetical protein
MFVSIHKVIISSFGSQNPKKEGMTLPKEFFFFLFGPFLYYILFILYYIIIIL